MRDRLLITILVFLLAPAPMMAQPGVRKVKRAAPVAYPEMARKIRLTGAVKLQLYVAADGKVTNVAVLGGHPILVNEAVATVKGWEYEPEAGPTTELVILHFQP